MIKLQNEDLSKLTKPELVKIAQENKVKFPDDATKATLVDLLDGIEVGETGDTSKTDETIMEEEVKQKVVTGKKVKLGSGPQVEIGPDEKVLSFTEYPDKYVYLVESKRTVEKREVKK